MIIRKCVCIPFSNARHLPWFILVFYQLRGQPWYPPEAPSTTTERGPRLTSFAALRFSLFPRKLIGDSPRPKDISLDPPHRRSISVNKKSGVRSFWYSTHRRSFVATNKPGGQYLCHFETEGNIRSTPGGWGGKRAVVFIFEISPVFFCKQETTLPVV